MLSLFRYHNPEVANAGSPAAGDFTASDAIGADNAGLRRVALTRARGSIAVSHAGEALRPQDVSTRSGRLGYFAFIDGLRAISILAVVSFHVGVPGVPGGFIGVDIFFVISGFLIISQIRASLSAGRFSIWSYLAQRGLRILPVYFIMLLATFAAAPFILPTPAVYWDFLASAATAPLMVTNVAFYLTQGYFDISALEKPLLHTWTLSVEEQFYFFAPLLLLLVFRLGSRKFGALAVAIGITIGIASLLGAIAKTSSSGPNQAFYLSPWRAWEFLAGGFIVEGAVAALARYPRAAIECLSWVGGACIVTAIATFHGGMPYPSWHAIVPVTGAVLVILCGLARPDITLVRFLELRWMVAIGLVSYGWYLWHWPILSFMRIARVGQESFIADALGGGVCAFALACLTYFYVERPIRRWRKSVKHLRSPIPVVLGLVATAIAIAGVGAASALEGYRFTDRFVADRYGIEGKGIIDAGCNSKTGFAETCFHGRLGILLGDSHATVLFGTFARRLDTPDTHLVSMAEGGCPPFLLSAAHRDPSRRDGCAGLIIPYERVLKQADAPAFVIISSIWSYTDDSAAVLSSMISEFPARTRVLLIGPVPIFHVSSLECVVLSDRFGTSRDQCLVPRSEVEASRASIVAVLKSMPSKFRNVRYVDPIDLFCDNSFCRPFKGDRVYYADIHHLTPAGADLVFDSFKNDFDWVAARH